MNNEMRNFYEYVKYRSSFMGGALKAFREKMAMSEQQMRYQLNLSDHGFDDYWLRLQGMSYPRSGEAFSLDVAGCLLYLSRCEDVSPQVHREVLEQMLATGKEWLEEGNYE